MEGKSELFYTFLQALDQKAAIGTTEAQSRAICAKVCGLV